MRNRAVTLAVSALLGVLPNPPARPMAYIGAFGFGLIAVVNSLRRRREKKRASEYGGVFCNEMPFFPG